MVKSAVRVIDVLECLADRPAGLTHAELSEALSIPKSSLTALVSELSRAGYVEHDAERRRFFLGARVVGLARRYLARIDIVQIAQPVVARLADCLGDSSALTVRSGDDMLVVCKQDADRPLKHSMLLGERGPIYASASGKACLVAEGSGAVAAFLATVELARITDHTITDRARLSADLDDTRRHGVGYSRGELIDGITAIAVAVLDADGRPVAGLSVSVPDHRCTPERCERVIEALRRHSAALSARLGAG